MREERAERTIPEVALKLLGLSLVGLGAFATVLGASAHHSFTATYDETRVIQIEGMLVEFMFRNPHAWVYVMAPDENGDMQRWGVEWGGAGQLAAQGLDGDSLQAGDHLIIRGNPGRNPADHRLRLQSLLRPADGFGWGFEGESFD